MSIFWAISIGFARVKRLSWRLVVYATDCVIDLERKIWETP